MSAAKCRLAAIDLDLLELGKKRVAYGETQIEAEDGPENIADIVGDRGARSVVAEFELQRCLERGDSRLEIDLGREPVVDEIIVQPIDADVRGFIVEGADQHIDGERAFLASAG